MLSAKIVCPSRSLTSKPTIGRARGAPARHLTVSRTSLPPTTHDSGRPSASRSTTDSIVARPVPKPAASGEKRKTSMSLRSRLESIRSWRASRQVSAATGGGAGAGDAVAAPETSWLSL